MSLPRTGPSPSASSVSRWLALFEGLGVEPYWTGEHAKEDAIGYATARAKFGRGEIRVLNHDGKGGAALGRPTDGPCSAVARDG